MDPFLYLIPILTPAIVSAVRRLRPRLPKQLLPVFAGAIGPVLDLLAAATTAHEGNVFLGVVLGLAGVGVREVKKQLLSTPSS